MWGNFAIYTNFGGGGGGSAAECRRTGFFAFDSENIDQNKPFLFLEQHCSSSNKSVNPPPHQEGGHRERTL